MNSKTDTPCILDASALIALVSEETPTTYKVAS